MKKLLICLFCASIASGALAQKAKIDSGRKKQKLVVFRYFLEH